MVQGDEEEMVCILTSVKPGHDVRPVGIDISLDQLVLAKGERLAAAEIGLLSAVGATQIKIVNPPKVAVLSTGNEVCTATYIDTCIYIYTIGYIYTHIPHLCAGAEG